VPAVDPTDLFRFMVPAQLSEKYFGSVPKYYIRASLDKVMSPPLQDEIISNWKVEQVFTLESGHFPLTSMANKLCETIKNITHFNQPEEKAL